MRIYLLLSCLVMIIQASSPSLSTAWKAFSGSQWRFFNLKMKNSLQGGKEVFIQEDIKDKFIDKNRKEPSKRNKNENQIISENINKYSRLQKSEDTEENTTVRLDKLLDRIIKYSEGKFVNMKRFVPLNVLISNKLTS